MFKKTKLLKTVLSLWMTLLLAVALYLMTGSLLVAILVAAIFVLFGICAELCQRGMDKMLGDEIYATKNGLPKGAMRGKALLHASMVLSPIYFLYMLPSFIPIPSVYAWAMVQFGFIIFAPLHLQTVGAAYRDITCTKKPFWIAQSVIFLLLTVLSFVIRSTVLDLLR